MSRISNDLVRVFHLRNMNYMYHTMETLENKLVAVDLPSRFRKEIASENCCWSPSYVSNNLGIFFPPEMLLPEENVALFRRLW